LRAGRKQPDEHGNWVFVLLNQFGALNPSSLCIATPGIDRLQTPSGTRNSRQNN
jgi:hypothetical protein